MAREEAAAAGRPLEADSLAERLRCLGHSVTVRTALGGGGGGECLRNLRHTFLSCAVHGAPHNHRLAAELHVWRSALICTAALRLLYGTCQPMWHHLLVCRRILVL